MLARNDYVGPTHTASRGAGSRRWRDQDFVRRDDHALGIESGARKRKYVAKVGRVKDDGGISREGIYDQPVRQGNRILAGE